MQAVSSIWGDDRAKLIVWHVDVVANVRRLVEVNLQRAGYEVHGFQTFPLCWDAFFSGRPKPDVLLVEVVGQDEVFVWQRLSRLKSDEKHRRIRIILLTEKDGDNFQGLIPRADDYLPKPFLPHELVNFVARALTGEPIRTAA